MSTIRPASFENAPYHQFNALLNTPETKLSGAYSDIQKLFRDYEDYCREEQVGGRTYILGPEIALQKTFKTEVIEEDDGSIAVSVEALKAVPNMPDKYGNMPRDVAHVMQVAIAKNDKKPGIGANCYIIQNGDVRNPKFTITSNGMTVLDINGVEIDTQIFEEVTYLNDIAKMSLEVAQDSQFRKKRSHKRWFGSFVFVSVLGSAAYGVVDYITHRDDDEKAALAEFDAQNVQLQGLELQVGQIAVPAEVPAYSNTDVLFSEIPSQGDGDFEAGTVRTVEVESGDCEQVTTLLDGESLAIAKEADTPADVLVVKDGDEEVYVCVPEFMTDSGGYIMEISLAVQKTKE